MHRSDTSIHRPRFQDVATFAFTTSPRTNPHRRVWIRYSLQRCPPISPRHLAHSRSKGRSARWLTQPQSRRAQATAPLHLRRNPSTLHLDVCQRRGRGRQPRRIYRLVQGDARVSKLLKRIVRRPVLDLSAMLRCTLRRFLLARVLNVLARLDYAFTGLGRVPPALRTLARPSRAPALCVGGRLVPRPSAIKVTVRLLSCV